MARGHFVEGTTLLGTPVLRRFTWRVQDDVRRVRERVMGKGGGDRFYEMDTIEGRDRLATHCVAPDMIPQEA